MNSYHIITYKQKVVKNDLFLAFPGIL